MTLSILVPAALGALRPLLPTLASAALSGALVGVALAYISNWTAMRLVPEAFDGPGEFAFAGAATAWLAAHEEESVTHPPTWPLAVVLSIVCAVCAAATVEKFGLSLTAALSFAFVATLLLVGAIDWRHRVLPDLITLPLVWLGLIVNIDHHFSTLPDAVVGAVVGYGVLWLLFLPLRILRETDGMGLGDLKLYAATGAWLGWTAMPQVFLVSLLLGTAGMLIKRLVARDSGDRISAFGPYIVAAALITAFAGTPFNTQFRIPASWQSHQQPVTQALPRT